jgi:hypothetical protein
MTQEPWYRRCVRWGQTNITEIDPTRYDIDWWREQWRRTEVQGVIVNAGGIVAYYPSRYPLTHYAEHLGERDMFGEVVAAAREEGLAVLARMDSNRVHEPFYVAHPDWMARDAEGEPYRAGEMYVTCVHSPYYDQYLPAVLREIAARYRPDGFTDNSFSGPNRHHISYSPYAARAFKEATSLDLPRRPDWDDPVYRRWIEWSYQRRLEIWDLNNEAAQEAGGPDCLWLGMTGGHVLGQGASLRDYEAICARSEIVMLDFQSRPAHGGLKQNGEVGKLVHGLLGWDKVIPESMAQYEHAARQPFRVASKSVPEARLWMVEGFAGTIQPWWHHIGAYHEDRRQYKTPLPLMRWHAKHESYLLRRQPVATVGVVWSQRSNDVYVREAGETRFHQPWQGITQSLVRARIPYLPVYVDHIARDAEMLSTLILPNVGALSDAQCQAVHRYVEQGGSLIVSGETAMYDEEGQRRPEMALSDLLGVRILDAAHGSVEPVPSGWSDWRQHSYLRLHPERRAAVDGPQTGQEPPLAGARHPMLAGFDETDILPFGGRLQLVEAGEGTTVPATFIPAFPTYPPETAWMRIPDSGLPALVLAERANGARTAYLAADVDRCFGRDHLPDHATLLANLVRWAAGDTIPLAVKGGGYVDCHLYRQQGRMILHLVNLTGTDTRPMYEFVPVGPLQVRVRLAEDVSGGACRLLVAGGQVPLSVEAGWARFEVGRIVDHEVAVIE